MGINILVWTIQAFRRKCHQKRKIQQRKLIKRKWKRGVQDQKESQRKKNKKSPKSNPNQIPKRRILSHQKRPKRKTQKSKSKKRNRKYRRNKKWNKARRQANIRNRSNNRQKPSNLYRMMLWNKRKKMSLKRWLWKEALQLINISQSQLSSKFTQINKPFILPL